ncbi:class I SAM-dependent methyltransferase [Amedibacillus dolichus]|uniref:Class I SAM-dependent methyltransferase n=1 Tax=Amedibacillus dolichus TaxID=31971 RepID=A0ABT7UEX8_9FIRM|nr:class I SAM-dependent methyltransferase [Amedibacillus dolichus]MDM8157513.1 class I SAM-dependent methyltransferase [Amedibacillus dolichus]
MERSRKGLEGAGEWPTLEGMLPDLNGLRMLDLGCGYGWHCRYAIQHGASAVVGVDLSERMLERARSMGEDARITYMHAAMETIDFPKASFDLILSSLAFHYVADYPGLLKKLHAVLRPQGQLLFSCEHPIFTAQGPQEWERDAQGNIRHFPVDHYFAEGARDACFLGEHVVKYHRTLTTLLHGLVENGFVIEDVQEPKPTAAMLAADEQMKEELRRPMMLIVSARRR